VTGRRLFVRSPTTTPNELAPSHSITSSASTMRVGSNSRPRAFRLEIDHEIKFGRLQYSKVSGLLTLKNPAGIDAYLAEQVCLVRSATHQAACYREPTQ